MRLIERPWKTPGRCAIVAHVDPVSVPTARWIDVDSILPGWDQHVFLSDVGVRQAMVLFGFPAPLEHEAALEDLAKVQVELEQAQAQIMELERTLSAIDTLEAADFVKRRKPGRPPKVAA